MHIDANEDDDESPTPSAGELARKSQNQLVPSIKETLSALEIPGVDV
jgi:hypothetical protein